MSLSRGIGPWLVAIVVPLAMAIAQGPTASDSSQSQVAASMRPMATGGHVMNGQMMGVRNNAQEFLTQLRANLDGLENVTDITVIHAKIAHERALISQLQTALESQCGMSMGQMGSQMHRGMMMGGPMPGAHMSHHGGAGANPRQRDRN